VWPREFLAPAPQGQFENDPRHVLARYVQTAGSILGQPYDGAEAAEMPIDRDASQRIRGEAMIMLETLDAFVAEVLQAPAGTAAASSASSI
jgi:hypothetical protein